MCSIMAWSTTFDVLVKVTNEAKIEAMLQRLEMGVPSQIRGACTNGVTVDRERVKALVSGPSLALELIHMCAVSATPMVCIALEHAPTRARLVW